MKKKTAARVLLAAAASAALPVCMLAPGRLPEEKKRPFTGVNFAHRGLHSRDESVPENSVEAFRLAAAEGYGVELDVQLSKDGQVVVFHDDTLERVCGVDRRVDELTYAQLQQLRLCGTEHTIPLFSQVLAAYNGAGPMIVELKTGRRNGELCEKTYKLLEKYEGDVCIESFDPRIVAWFRLHAPKIVRGQLAMAAINYPKPKENRLLDYLLSHTMLNFLARPNFIAYDVVPQRPLAVRLCERLGAIKIGWVAHEDRYEEEFDSVIFEYYRPEPRFGRENAL